MTRKKKSEDLDLWQTKANKIGFYKILKQSINFKDFFQKMIENKIMFSLLIILNTIYTWSIIQLNIDNIYFEGMGDLKSFVYYNNTTTLAAYYFKMFFWLFLLFWFFSYFSVMLGKKKRLDYFLLMSPRFYFYTSIFVAILFIFMWIFVAIIKNNFIDIEWNLLGSTLNESLNYILDLVFENGLLMTIFLSLVLVLIVYFVFSLSVGYLVFFYNSYILKNGVINSLWFSLSFLKKNNISVFYILLLCGLILFITGFLINLMPNYFLVPILTLGYYYLAFILLFCMQNSIFKYKY